MGAMRDHQSARTREESREVRRLDGNRGDPYSQLCSSLCCSLAGIAIFLGALALAAYNERSGVCAARALDAARGYVAIGCEGSAAEQRAAHRGGAAPAYFACPIAEESLPTWTPSSFGALWLEGAFEVRAVKLRQQVEMYQCQEERRVKEVKGTDRKNMTQVETIAYTKAWSERHIPSDSFRGWNDPEVRRAMEAVCGASFGGNPLFPMESQTQSAPSLVVGGYEMSRHLPSIFATAPVAVKRGPYRAPFAPPSGRQGPERRIATDGEGYTRQEFHDYYGEDRGSTMWEEAVRQPAAGSQGGATGEVRVGAHSVQTCGTRSRFYAGRPEVGCLRISYFQSTATHASCLAALADGSRATRPWIAPPSWMCGSGGPSSQVDLFAVGRSSAEQLIADAAASNLSQMWLMRALIFILAVVGVRCFLQPLQTIVDVADQSVDWFRAVPMMGRLVDFLGDVVAGAVGSALMAVSLGIALPSALGVAGLTWCLMRPLLAIPLLGACAALLGCTACAMRGLAASGRGKRKLA